MKFASIFFTASAAYFRVLSQMYEKKQVVPSFVLLKDVNGVPVRIVFRKMCVVFVSRWMILISSSSCRFEVLWQILLCCMSK